MLEGCGLDWIGLVIVMDELEEQADSSGNSGYAITFEPSILVPTLQRI